ncbi:S-adenosyl-L-methionine-dependent methyltransferase-like [Moorella glycerini]|uniref:Bifunctional 3-demethylubiquinone-9 3-methyltransferase/ 2-octaprenyl-6-hydroxy phenol methylase n=1 Tax=Neomoorella stamsii TaxID=1266720 RepID=A0A9X7J4Q7_9FIRM|nr:MULTISPECIES: class I SAM-dependent methyltransferase [Moorella]PRR73800.1 bifunctional 3-demethylubiquinone-9 3-methyltransferase/ 2-octaprenyl-6-hydroxy phenol methylase [Moorella stamsii]CEP67182.1 S-adenosyl-L-methionine-dependent methyltransferase-like [Moorella glycerini]
MDSLIDKYDRLAEGFTAREYANKEFYMYRRLLLTLFWGVPLKSGDSVLELGCGDGYLARSFIRYGLRYHGVDFAPERVRVAGSRLREAGLDADLTVADVNELSLTEPYDAVVAYMRTFFAYTREPLAVLRRLRPCVRKKIILDLNPRRDLPVKKGIALLQEAGFRRVTWRPFLVPKEKRLPPALLRVLVSCEDVPLVRSLPLRWKFHCLLKGEP